MQHRTVTVSADGDRDAAADFFEFRRTVKHNALVRK